MIEYHFGYKNIKKKLESCGFSVTHSKPIPVKQPTENYWKKSYMYAGYIFAKRN